MSVFGQNTGYSPNYTGTGNGCQAGGTCYYIDYVNGSDANTGLSKTAAWKSVPGMTCATGNAASHSFAQTDEFILKGGDTWPYSCVSGTWTIAGGGAGTPNSYAYPGMYVGYDPTWNAGTVNSVRVVDPGNCTTGTTLSVSLAGGGGSGATATTTLESIASISAPTLLDFVTVTNQGSGYTSNPSVSFAVTAGSCSRLPIAYADIYSPVISAAGGVMGTASSIPPMFTFNASYGTVDHLEFAHDRIFSTAYTGGGNPNMLNSFGTAITFQNLYVHDFAMNDISSFNANCVVSGNAECNLDVAQSAAIYLGDENGVQSKINNNIFNNYESEAEGCAANSTSGPPCVEMTAVLAAPYSGTAIGGIITNNIIHNWRGSLYTLGNTSTSLVAGNWIWAALPDVGTQHGDTYYLQDGGLTYNNKLSDIFPGTAAFYIETGDGSNPTVGLKNYLFNNVAWDVGTSTPPIGWTSEYSNSGATSMSPTPDLRAYNNTFYAYQGTADCMNAGQWFSASVALQAQYAFTIYNNHCISSQSTSHWYDANGGEYGVWNTHANPNLSATQALIDPLNVTDSPATATTQGYTAGNSYAPTASTNDTVTFASGGNSQNLTNLCATSLNGLSLSALCSDINGNARPTSGGWQAGAYQYGSGTGTSGTSGAPAPPSNLGVTVLQ
jgi:hypothetical protein